MYCYYCGDTGYKGDDYCHCEAGQTRIAASFGRKRWRRNPAFSVSGDIFFCGCGGCDNEVTKENNLCFFCKESDCTFREKPCMAEDFQGLRRFRRNPDDLLYTQDTSWELHSEEYWMSLDGEYQIQEESPGNWALWRRTQHRSDTSRSAYRLLGAHHETLRSARYWATRDWHKE